MQVLIRFFKTARKQFIQHSRRLNHFLLEITLKKYKLAYLLFSKAKWRPCFRWVDGVGRLDGEHAHVARVDVVDVDGDGGVNARAFEQRDYGFNFSDQRRMKLTLTFPMSFYK